MSRKNVLILHTDQQRYDSLGCSGNAYARTPNIDQLAAEGTRFTRHIASNPVCMPSRASLMTGLYPPGHGVWTNGIALNRRDYARVTPPAPDWGIELAPQPPTLADVYAGAGYDAVSFGKLHLTPNLAPPEYGYHETWSLWEDGAFDDWHGPYYGFRFVDMTTGHGEQPCMSGHYGVWLQSNHPRLFEQVVENQQHKSLPVPGLGDLYASPLTLGLHHSAWLADRFCQYLEDRPSDDRPFFAFVGFPDPHHPFTPCYDSIELFGEAEVKEPSDPNGEGLVDSPVRKRFGTDIAHLSADERRMVVRYTYAMVYQIDRAVGRIVEALKKKGLWEETILVFTSDHGDFLGDHGRLRKNTVGSDALLHLPFVLRAPGAGLPDSVETPMSNVDVMPTLTALTGIEPPEWQHGRDMTSVIETGAEHYAFAFCSNGNPAHLNYTVYDANYRLTYYPHWDYTELYDHRTDPGECANLAAKEIAQAERLMDALRSRLVEIYNPIVGRVCLW